MRRDWTFMLQTEANKDDFDKQVEFWKKKPSVRIVLIQQSPDKNRCTQMPKISTSKYKPSVLRGKGVFWQTRDVTQPRASHSRVRFSLSNNDVPSQKIGVFFDHTLDFNLHILRTRRTQCSLLKNSVIRWIRRNHFWLFVISSHSENCRAQWLKHVEVNQEPMVRFLRESLKFNERNFDKSILLEQLLENFNHSVNC